MTGESFGPGARDPRFPGRPQHPDFWRLSRVVRAQDAAAEAGDFNQAVSDIIDPESVTYAATNRAQRLTADPKELARMSALWVDGFAAGVAYAREQEKEE